MKYSWSNLDDIAIDLYEKYPNINPINIKFTQLLDFILGLENFTGKREECNESKLEAIQMAWLEEWNENN
jgi:FeS assembly protein IscX